VETGDDLPEEFVSDAGLELETDELWVLFREPDHRAHLPRAFFVMRGDELRDLVSRAVALLETLECST